MAGQDPIHIKESRRGSFTAAAKAAGMSDHAFAHHVLADKAHEPESLVKKAEFAENIAYHGK